MSQATEAAREHWNAIHSTQDPTQVSWYQVSPAPSLAMFDRLGISNTRSVVDVGGGTSALVDRLIERGHSDLAVLDVSGEALSQARARLGSRAEMVRWIEADVRAWRPDQRYDVWHDRAVFHFLTEEADRSNYAEALRLALVSGGLVILATFAPDGPESCSGLQVARYGSQDLRAALAAMGLDFAIVETMREEHRTPWGAVQPFTWLALKASG